MNLRDRCGRQGLRLELGKDFFHGTAIEPAQQPLGGSGGKRRDLILQARKFCCDVVRKQVGPGRDVLPELHEYRTQFLQGLSQTPAA